MADGERWFPSKVDWWLGAVLAIEKGPGFFDAVLISPKEKDAFLALLADRAGLVREGDSLVRR